MCSVAREAGRWVQIYTQNLPREVEDHIAIYMLLSGVKPRNPAVRVAVDLWMRENHMAQSGELGHPVETPTDYG
jgi:hypothetical protein